MPTKQFTHIHKCITSMKHGSGKSVYVFLVAKNLKHFCYEYAHYFWTLNILPVAGLLTTIRGYVYTWSVTNLPHCGLMSAIILITYFARTNLWLHTHTHLSAYTVRTHANNIAVISYGSIIARYSIKKNKLKMFNAPEGWIKFFKVSYILRMVRRFQIWL